MKKTTPELRLAKRASSASRGPQPTPGRASTLAVRRAKASSTDSKAVSRPKRRPNALRFSQVAGKTVAFVEMDSSADFPCVEIAFDDKTALLFLLGTRLTIEPSYSDWKTGNMRELPRWRQHQTDAL